MDCTVRFSLFSKIQSHLRLSSNLKGDIRVHRALIKYDERHEEVELLKELCEMSFETQTKQSVGRSAEAENCCACDEAVYEVNLRYAYTV